jgi:hypothetical protein
MRGLHRLCALVIVIFGSQVQAASPPEPAPSPSEILAMLESVVHITEGVPPGADTAAVSLSATRSVAELGWLYERLEALKFQALDAKCFRFVTVSRHLTSALHGLLSAAALAPGRLLGASNSDFEFVTRIQLAISAFAELQAMVSSGEEGGYGVLDPEVKKSCDFPERKEVADGFSSSIVQMSDFFHLAFGSLGLNQMEQAQERLLKLAVAEEPRNRNRFIAVMIGGTLVSIALWRFAPPLAEASIRMLWGYTPQILARPAFLYGARVSALIAEGVAFSYATDLSSTKVEAPQMRLHSYEEYLEAFDTLATSPLHTPDLDFIFLGRVHATLFQRSAAWIAIAKPILLEQEKRWGSLKAALDQARLNANEVQK